MNDITPHGVTPALKAFKHWVSNEKGSTTASLLCLHRGDRSWARFGSSSSHTGESQKCRIPCWPALGIASMKFSTNVPEYFDRLLTGREPIKIVDKPSEVVVLEEMRPLAKTFGEFYRGLVPVGRRMPVNPVKVI